MEILWLAILFYSIGLGAVLHFRPVLMFHENGTWKEFGYQRSARYTIFPVWLFAIVWAIVSYTLAAAIVWAWRAGAAEAATFASASSAAAMHYSSSVPVADEDDEDDTFMGTPVSAMPEEEEAEPETNRIPITETIRVRPNSKRIQTPARQPRKGYYILDPASEKSGLRRYVYYGEAPPPELQSGQTGISV
jgi:hypothetical protein